MDLKKEYKGAYNTIDREEYWIVEIPLKTDYGYIKTIKVKDMIKYSEELDFLKLQDWEIKDSLKTFLSQTEYDKYEKDKELIEDFQNEEFINILRYNILGVRDRYNNIFKKFVINFDEKCYWKMTSREFKEFRKLILDYNAINYYERNPNPEIEKFNLIKFYIAQKKGQNITFDIIYTTLMSGLGGGHSGEHINNMTTRQFYHLFKRIEFIRMNEITTLYKTVDTKDAIKVIEWSSPIEKDNNGDKEFSSVEELKRKNAFLS